MWNDNETELDLLGFDDLVAQITDLVRQPSLLPLTIGVYGDWGSGKSSLMSMARAQLKKDARVLTVSFSPWQHEDYDDVKTALILAVMSELRSQRPLLDRAKAAGKTSVEQLLTRLRRRVNLLRAVSWAVKGISATMAAAHGEGAAAALLAGSSIGDAIAAVKPVDVANAAAKALDEAAEDGNADDDPVEQSVGQFRQDFAALLRELDIDVLVVFIDDLDRCLPETVVDTLEAVRLFLAVPKTAFVIGADERIVRHAIGRRYPELPSQGIDIGRDYLEKMVQIPLRIPPMSAAETESYLNLLGAQLHLAEIAYGTAIDAARSNRQRRISVPFNYGVAQTALGTVPTAFAGHMALIARIAPVLATGLQGNPRQTKRFLNTLVQRQRLAARRNIALEVPVLAKLMVLEYFQTAQFRELFRWQAEAPGRPAQLAELERAVKTPPKKDPAADLKRWLDDPGLRRWLEQEPALAKVDLQPYFHFSRDRISPTAPPTRRLPQELQELILRLQSASDVERDGAKDELLALGDAEARAVFDELAAVFVSDPRAVSNKLGPLLVSVAVARRALVPALADAFNQANPNSVQPALALGLRVPFKSGPLPQELRRVLERWESDGPTNLANAARRALA